MLHHFISAALALATLGTAAADASRPNIVFFLLDDLGYADCGFNGGTQIKTPNIDKLAAEGTVLESHYVQPVCSPTRAALLTGRYATRTGVYTIVRPHAKWGLPLEERTLANALQETGYATAIVGKWHLGEFDPAHRPMARGFQHQHGHYFGAIDYFKHTRDGDHDWQHDDKKLKEEGYATHLLAKEACRLIETQDQGKPLFLYIPFNAVHSPMQVPDRYLAPYQALKGEHRQLAGMLACADEAVGKIVGALEKKGMRDNTLIVFSSDNGGPPPGDNTPLRGFKGSLWEGGVRSCAFANWPGRVPAGKRVKEPMHIIDWYPTLIKIAGGSLEQKLPIDGKDVWPMLNGNASSPHDAILIVESPTRAALRMGDWKLVVNRDSTNEKKKSGNPSGKKAKKNSRSVTGAMLFNLTHDIGEKTNLAAQEPGRVDAMMAQLEQMMRHAAPCGASNAGRDQ